MVKIVLEGVDKMKVNSDNNIVEFDNNEEELVMRLALVAYKDYLEESDGISDQDYVTRQNLEIVSRMLDQFQYIDDASEE